MSCVVEINFSVAKTFAVTTLGNNGAPRIDNHAMSIARASRTGGGDGVVEGVYGQAVKHREAYGQSLVPELVPCCDGVPRWRFVANLVTSLSLLT